MFLVPAVGVPSELMLQDTLKSAIVAFGTLGAALLFFWQQRNRSTPMLWHGLVWLPLALMAYALGSMVWSHTYLAGVEAIRWFLLALLLWLGLNTLTKDTIPTLLWGIHAGAVVASMWVTLQFWFDLQWFPQGAAPASTFINRNFYAEYAVSALPLSFWLLASLPPSRKVLAMAASIVLCVVAILMTGTRSALVAMLVIAPVIVFIGVRYRHATEFARWPKVLRSGVAAVFVLGIAGLGSIPTGNPALGAGTTPLGFGIARTASMAKSTEYTVGSFSIRSQMWKATARMVMANPVTGVGAGAWEVNIPLFQRDDTFSEMDYYAHNEYLQLLSEYGLVVGGLCIAFLWAYLLHAMGKTWALRGSELPEGPFRAIALTSLLALLLVCNAGFPLHLAACGALLMVGLAILCQSDVALGYASEATRMTHALERHKYQGPLVILGICLAIAGFITYEATLAERKLMNAQLLAVRLTKPPALDAATRAHYESQLVLNLREGVQIHPHYRKITGPLGDMLAAGGDWKSATWAWASVAASRPNVVGLWSYLALGYSHQGEHRKAHEALVQLQRLRPDAMETRTLEITLLSRSGRTEDAVQLLNDYFDQGLYDYDRIMTAYAIGYSTQHWPLAIRAITLRNKAWPKQAVDGYFRLGTLYAHPAVHDDTNALIAFREGYRLVPAEEKTNYSLQVPLKYRHAM
jgi:O-antigen ligase